MEKKKKISIGIVALVGFITTIYLAVIYYNANFNPFALSSFCSVNNFIDCDGIAKTTDSQFMGIPLAYWGMFLYLFITFLLFVDKLKNIKFLKFLEVFKNPESYIAALGLISFTISMCLLGLSLFSIKKLCILCAFTYVLNLSIGLIAVKGIGFVEAFKNSVKDFVSAISVKKYAIAFVLVLLVVGGFLSYTKFSYVFTPQVKRQNEFKEFVDAKYNKYAVSGNVLGKEDAKIVIYSYTDYRCPMCRAYNIMVHKLVKEVPSIKVVHKNLPLDTACNRYMRKEFHEGSCTMAKYVIAAEKQGKFWDLNNKFFDEQPKSEPEMIEIAVKLGLDIEQLKIDANSLETMRQIQADIEEATDKGINGTPTTVIGDKVYIGVKPFKEMKQWVKDAEK